ncbi:hypothetical protein C8J56DRAFT_1171771 [Mycena floridula]|nr:hypothetical protein C8J56DRAFT_1171771 [Mycena floridula]
MTIITFESFHALIEPEIPQHWEDHNRIGRELDEILVRWNRHLERMVRFNPSVGKTTTSQFLKPISDPQYELDLHQGQQFGADMAQVLRFDINLIHRVNTIVAATYNIPYSVYAIGENNEANIIVIITPVRTGQLIPVNPSFLRPSDRPIAMDTAALRASLLTASKSTDYVTFLRVSSQPWANAILELLQLEIKLSDMLQAVGSVDGSYKQQCMRCLRQISSAYEVLPPSFLIQASNVIREGSNPVCGGGFADIWKGLDEPSGQKVCLKVLRFFTTTHIRKKLLQDVCREALVWKQLDHPGVLKFLGVSVDMFTPSFCLVSPWMANGNINDYLQLYPDHDCLIVLREVAEAMQYLHEFTPCIVHADIRGANILVTNDGHCVLADFGLASVSETQSFATSSVRSKGSVRWLSPEVLLPTAIQRKPHPSRDIYAYGCTALEIYTKLPPFHLYTHDAMILIDLIAGKGPERPTQEEAPSLTDDVWQLIQRCWTHQTSDRPQAREVVEELMKLTRLRISDQMKSLGEEDDAEGVAGIMDDGFEEDEARQSCPTGPNAAPTDGDWELEDENPKEQVCVLEEKVADSEHLDDESEEATDDDIDLAPATAKILVRLRHDNLVRLCETILVRLRHDDLVRLCETHDLEPVGTKPQLAKVLLEWHASQSNDLEGLVPNKPSPPKWVKTEWDGPPTEAIRKQNEAVEKALQSDDEAMAFFDKMTELLSQATNAETQESSDLSADLTETLNQILKGCSAIPDAPDSSLLDSILNPHPAPISHQQPSPQPGAHIPLKPPPPGKKALMTPNQKTPTPPSSTPVASASTPVMVASHHGTLKSPPIEVASLSNVPVKRPREEDMPVSSPNHAFSPAEFTTDELSPSKRVKTEWEGPPPPMHLNDAFFDFSNYDACSSFDIDSELSKAKVEEFSDPLQLGVLREIDGGEAAYYHSNEWKYDTPMSVLEQPWAMSTSKA